MTEDDPCRPWFEDEVETFEPDPPLPWSGRASLPDSVTLAGKQMPLGRYFVVLCQGGSFNVWFVGTTEAKLVREVKACSPAGAEELLAEYLDEDLATRYGRCYPWSDLFYLHFGQGEERVRKSRSRDWGWCGVFRRGQRLDR